jgi:hypothetical protein
MKYMNVCNLGILILFPVVINCQNRIFKDKLSLILDIDNVKIKKSQSIDEFGGSGEGYTFEVYKLSEKTIKAFIDNPAKGIRYNHDSTWKKKDWAKVPIDTIYNEVLLMCLNYDSGNKKLANKLVEIRKTLTQANVYYALYYKPDKYNPENAQLFVLDIEGKNLYIIESNF